MQLINVNGRLVEHDQPCILATNHSYRYGHGLFETMKVRDGVILLSDLHFERLFKGISILKISVPESFSLERLQNEITDLCNKNNCEKLARVRLSVSGGNGGLNDTGGAPDYLIECWPLTESVKGLNNAEGLIVDVFADARKSCDVFSNLKCSSHLPYVMAARSAKENKFNDCFVLNNFDRICDSTIANVFWIKNGAVFTPPLSEGCIAGVMRRYLINKSRLTKYKAQEKMCEVGDLESADEIFLTNAIRGIRWVKRFRGKDYLNIVTAEIYKELVCGLLN